MGTSFIPLCAIIAVLIIAFLFASLPQVSHKMRYRVLYAIAIIMLFAVIPISEYMAENTKNSNSNYLLVLIFNIAVGYFCMYIAALLKFNILKRKNQALGNALAEKQQENVDAQHLQTIKPDTIQGSIRKLLNPPDKIIQHFQQESDCSRHNKLNGRQWSQKKHKNGSIQSYSHQRYDY